MCSSVRELSQPQRPQSIRGVRAAAAAHMPPLCRGVRLPWCVIFATTITFLSQGAVAQEPTKAWRPRYTSLGSFCSKGLKGNDGDCGCENTQFRTQNGSMYIMESVATHPCRRLFPAVAPGNAQACSYFRIRELLTGRIVANISESIDHDFCSAVADHGRDTLWVFCSAFGRRNKAQPGPCQQAGGYSGCYVGAWKTKLSGDLASWTPTAKALTLPAGMGMANNAVTLVSGTALASRHAPIGQLHCALPGCSNGKLVFAVTLV